MPFTNGGITALSVEQYEYCEKELARLNEWVQTLNEKEIKVKIEVCFMQGIVVTPTWGKITDLRVKPPPGMKDFWIDYTFEKKQVSIRSDDKTIYIINLEVEKDGKSK